MVGTIFPKHNTIVSRAESTRVNKRFFIYILLVHFSPIVTTPRLHAPMVLAQVFLICAIQVFGVELVYHEEKVLSSCSACFLKVRMCQVEAGKVFSGDIPQALL